MLFVRTHALPILLLFGTRLRLFLLGLLGLLELFLQLFDVLFELLLVVLVLGLQSQDLVVVVVGKVATFDGFFV